MLNEWSVFGEKSFIDVKTSQWRQNEVKVLKRWWVRSLWLYILWIIGGNVALVGGNRECLLRRDRGGNNSFYVRSLTRWNHFCHMMCPAKGFRDSESLTGSENDLNTCYEINPMTRWYEKGFYIVFCSKNSTYFFFTSFNQFETSFWRPWINEFI